MSKWGAHTLITRITARAFNHVRVFLYAVRGFNIEVPSDVMAKILRCPKCGFTRTKYAWDDMTSTNGEPNIHELGFEREMRLDRKHMEQCDSLYTAYEVLQPYPNVRCDVYRPDVQTCYSKARGARVGGAEMPTRIAEFNQYLNKGDSI